jgi:HK97 family phage prohead protease
MWRSLVKEGILGAFSVGFRVKDADYLSETDGLKIKDAELFEVSVVSVPCNQAATFSLAKSFDSMKSTKISKKLSLIV